MKKIIKSKGLQKATAILLTVVMVLSVFAVLPDDLFKVSAAETSERLELDFNNNWKFTLGNESGAYLKAYDDSAWETVELPHDFSISQEFFSSGTEAESGNLPGGTGWYRKMFVMPAEYREKSIILNFDGSYKDTYVYVNGELIGENHYGYNSFSFDISEHLVCNGTTANLISVKVEHQLPSSRWYSGSGIYRDVTMTIVDPVHVDLYGTYVTTPNLESSNGTDGTVNAEITLVNTNVEKTVTVEAQILDATGNAVGTAASVETVVPINTDTTVTLTPVLENPTLWNSWDLGTPYLYTLRTTVSENGTVIDIYDTEFGYRWFNWDLDGGFSLNGTNVKLEGVCMHHDQGSLGAVQVYDAIYRQVAILKDMGCNAIRTSHGTPSDVFMDVCNELGMLVMNEFFDGWDTAKNDNSNDFSVYFDQTIDTSTNNLLGAEDGQMWYEFVLTQSVKRDRNDPAVVIWDVGNEISEGASVGDFETIAGNMRTMLDTLDPTRPVCQGNNQRNVTSGWPYNVEKYMTVTGGNYQPGTWAGMYSDIAALTDAVTGEAGNSFVMTETTSATSTRGVYDTLSHYNYVCSGYDTDYVSWGTSAAGTWYTTITNDWFSGAFVWTGFDYIGEPTHWNHTTGNYGAGSPVSSFFGIIDTAGFAKDTYYLYRSLWNEHSNTLHLVPGTWDSNVLAKNGNYAYVAVYSNADHIELLGDGNVIATAQSTTTTTNAGHKYQTWTETAVASNVNTTEFYTGTGKDLYPQFQVNYSAYSTLTVKAYDANGNDITDSAVGTKSVSAVEATKVVATTWSESAYTADGDSYIYVELEAQDANGNFDSTYNGTATVTLNGSAAEIVGVDNGSQTSVDKFQQSSVFTADNTVEVQLYNGKAVVVLRTNEEVDDAVELTFTAENATIENNVSITSAAETGDELADEFEEVVDQSDVKYEPTAYDKYESLYNKITAGGTATSSNEYTEYRLGSVAGNITLDQVTSTDNNSFSDGWYVITGVADYMSFSEGVMTHTTSGSGLHTDGTTIGTTPSTSSDSWYFERQSSGKYYIYHEDANGTKQYLNLSTSNATISTTAQELEVVVSSSGVTIGNGSGYYLNYSGGESDVAGVWTAATSLTLYKVSGTAATTRDVIETGKYVIYNNDTRYSNASGILTGTIDSIGIPIEITTPSNGIITTESENAYTITLVDGTTDEYYIQNSEGKYLSIGSSGGSISFSDTATSVNVYVRDDGSINIYNADSSQFLDHYYSSSQNHYNTWSSTTSASDVNRIFVLYRNESGVNVPANKQNLYAALQEGIQHAPGTYSTASYNALFTALEDGYAVFENENATDEEIANATTAINEAIAGLTIEHKYIPTTLYKYGYYPETDTPYAGGGIAFNAQTYASMKAIIEADDNLVAQIKTAIDYDGANTTWLDGEADAALAAAIEKYAQIYSLSFTGAPVAGESTISDFAKTRWNVWTKTDTQGASESKDEGASVQGIFSALRVDGQPTDHAEYSELPYSNVTDANSSFDTSSGIAVAVTVNGTETNITLPALQGISVHINDLFKKEVVYVDDADTTQGYSKFYWDLNFPLVTTTNEYGINTFRYSSSSTEYVFQADFDDATNTATAELTPVDDWSVNRDGNGTGTGFFPFNYQNGTTAYTGENAIYHYAFNFNTDFYIPSSGTYADGEDVIFNFSGDDDVLVYIDDVLVLDNGGLHGARAASINFTDATLSYQYAMNVDAEDGLVESTTENAVTYAYGVTNTTANADELAALEKLNEVRTDGEYHTFSFYYIERGSTDSNCEIEFNLQQASEHVLLHDQTLVLDYGLPVEYYDVKRNDTITEEGQAATIEYLGVLDANVEVNSVVTFSDPENLSKTFADYGEIIDIDGLKYGTAKMTKEGKITYTPTTLQMTGRDFFYFCASIANDPTYASDTVYYQYERINFIPATSIYYEDNYDYGISFVDGTTTDGSGYGEWQTVGDETLFADAMQSDDLSGDSAANPYGYDAVYTLADDSDTKDYTQFSGFSAQMVTVSAANNTKNGGTNPTVEFEFTGTGFDVISVTDNTTGVFYVEIFDADGNRVGKRRMVDTYYGYSYGQIYLDADGNNTLEVTDTPAYKTNGGHATTAVTYYDVDGTTITADVTYLDVSGTGYTETPTYYDADGNLTETETENPAYAYAYAFGWIENSDATGLYQIPVIKINDLDYGTYSVVITPMYTAMFDHNGSGEFNLYVDAIRIYDPAGKDDDIEDKFILQAYKDDNESYTNYLEIKDMLIGADSLSEDAATQGVIFIDGIAALDNDLETYKLAGPNNELYLSNGQAVAFEIWASQVPDEVQLGVKSVQGAPTFSLTYGDNSAEKVINTATEMNYILNSMLPIGGKLTWTAVEVDGTTYYTTGTVVIQNTSADASILSITSMKWNFTGVGQYGHYEVTTNEEVENLNLMATDATISEAYSMMAARNEETDDGAEDVIPETPENPVEPEAPVVPEDKNDTVTDNEDVKDNGADENTNNNNANSNANTGSNSSAESNKVVVNEPITVTVTTSTGVTELIIRDENGNVITPEELECTIETIDNKEVKVWTITLTETESGTYTYSVIGEFEDGTVEEQEEITITVTAPEENEGFFAKLAGFFEDIVEFFKNLIAKIDIA